MNALRATPRAAVAAGGAVLVLIAIVIAAVLALRSGSPACFAGDPKSPSPAADPALYAGAVPVKGSTQLSIDMARGELLGARTR
ncbi:MAG: hypothetical protein QOD51_1709, partial [Candidatus Eremiobacteraeota bacterium]|nr:hypothetical protein [Candidatus Eremiobacteraeota bacterium]